MKTITTQSHTCLDCQPGFLPQLQNTLHELGIGVSRIFTEQSFIMGVTCRVYFTRPVPEILLEILCARLTNDIVIHEN